LEILSLLKQREKKTKKGDYTAAKTAAVKRKGETGLSHASAPGSK